MSNLGKLDHCERDGNVQSSYATPDQQFVHLFLSLNSDDMSLFKIHGLDYTHLPDPHLPL